MAESAPPLMATPKAWAVSGNAETALSMADNKAGAPNDCKREELGTSLLVAAIGHETLQALVDKLLGAKARNLTQGVG